MPAEQRVVLHPSPVRLGLVVSAPLSLLLLGIVALLDGGWSPGAGVILLVGLVLFGVVAVDVPYRVDFDRDGITRACLVRTQHLPWSGVVAVSRTTARPGLRLLLQRSRTGDGTPPVTARAGLVARRGARGTVLLVDRCESHAEWAALRDLLRDRATAFSAPPPPVDHPPAGRGPHALHARR